MAFNAPLMPRAMSPQSATVQQARRFNRSTVGNVAVRSVRHEPDGRATVPAPSISPERFDSSTRSIRQPRPPSISPPCRRTFDSSTETRQNRPPSRPRPPDVSRQGCAVPAFLCRFPCALCADLARHAAGRVTVRQAATSRGSISPPSTCGAIYPARVRRCALDLYAVPISPAMPPDG